MERYTSTPRKAAAFAKGSEAVSERNPRSNFKPYVRGLHRRGQDRFLSNGVRGFLCGVGILRRCRQAADAIVTGAGSLEMLFNCGIPGAAAWRN